MTPQEILWTAGSYALGAFTAGWYLVRWTTGRDLRDVGTGTLGARNAGRAAGWWAFFATILLDAAKGFAAVFVARRLGADGWALLAPLAAVVAGHLWPAQLGFRGGKGVVVTLGALLAWDPALVLLVAALALPAAAVLRSFTVGGMTGFAASPLAAHLADRGGPAVAAAAVGAGFVLTAHRTNLREAFARGRAVGRAAPGSPRVPADPAETPRGTAEGGDG